MVSGGLQERTPTVQEMRLLYATYGTERANAYRILEDTLNLKDVRIYDKVVNDNGDEVRVLNKKETMLASQKQDALKAAFKIGFLRISRGEKDW